MHPMLRLTVILSAVLLLLEGALVWVGHIQPPVRPQPAKQGYIREQPVQPEPVLLDRPTALLLMGVDQRRNDPGRTDALVVITVHPQRKNVKILNIPRDLKTRLILGKGHTSMDKINHAYALGQGVTSTVRTLEAFLDIPIDHYVKVNMEGFRAIIDLFHGVDVDSPRSFTYKGHRFRKGPMHLNGAQALAYVRDRTGTNDFDRHRREQQVLRSLWDKSKAWTTLFKLNRLFDILRRHVDTSLTLRDAFSLYHTLSRVPDQNIEILRLGGRDNWGHRYYFIVSEKERRRVRAILRRHLELEG